LVKRSMFGFLRSVTQRYSGLSPGTISKFINGGPAKEKTARKSWYHNVPEYSILPDYLYHAIILP
jgi:hypothetical protein